MLKLPRKAGSRRQLGAAHACMQAEGDDSDAASGGNVSTPFLFGGTSTPAAFGGLSPPAGSPVFGGFTAVAAGPAALPPPALARGPAEPTLEDIIALIPEDSPARRTPTGGLWTPGGSLCLDWRLEDGDAIEDIDLEELSLLCAAVVANDVGLMRRLVEDHGHDVDEKGARGESACAAHLAALLGHTDCLLYLHQAGASLGKPDEHYDGDSLSRTPAFWACKRGHVGCLQVLVDARVDLTHKWGTARALEEVAQANGHQDCAALVRQYKGVLRGGGGDGGGESGEASRGLADLVERLEPTMRDHGLPWLTLEEGTNDPDFEVERISLLAAAVLCSDMAAVRCLVEQHGHDVNAPCDDQRTTAAHIAAYRNEVDILRFLKQKGARCLDAGPNYKHGDDVDEDEDEGDEDDEDDYLQRATWSPAVFAAGEGHLPALEFLRDARCDLSKGSLGKPRGSSAKRAYKGKYRHLRGGNPAHVAAEGGHVTCLALLRDAGVDLKYNVGLRGKTAICRAACQGQAECLDLLLRAGAMNKDPSDIVDVLHDAAEYPPCVSLLIEAGYGKMMGKDNWNQSSAAWAAASAGWADSLRLMVDAVCYNSCNLNAECSRSRLRTPLACAVTQGHSECADLLRSHIKKGLSASWPAPGRLVRITGLQSEAAQQFEGIVGEAVSINPESSRWKVKLPVKIGQRSHLSVKRECLEYPIVAMPAPVGPVSGPGRYHRFGRPPSDLEVWEVFLSRHVSYRKRFYAESYPNRTRRSKEEASEVHQSCGAAMSDGHRQKEMREGSYLAMLERLSDVNYAMRAAVVHSAAAAASQLAPICFTKSAFSWHGIHYFPPDATSCMNAAFRLFVDDASIVDLFAMDFINPANGKAILTDSDLLRIVNESGLCLDHEDQVCPVQFVFVNGASLGTAVPTSTIMKMCASSLMGLTFVECPAAVDPEILQHIAKTCKGLRCLRLDSNPLTDEGFATLVGTGCSQLEFLSISGCNDLTDAALQSLADAACAPLLVTLLANRTSGITAAGLERLTACTALAVLHSDALNGAAALKLLDAGVPLESTLLQQNDLPGQDEEHSGSQTWFAERHRNVANLVTMFEVDGSWELPHAVQFQNLLSISCSMTCVTTEELQTIADSCLGATLRELQLARCTGVGNPQSLHQIARLTSLITLDLHGCLGYGPYEWGNGSDRGGNTRELLAISRSCASLEVLDLSFNEEDISVMAEVVCNLPRLHTFILVAAYGGVEYPNVLVNCVRQMGKDVRHDFEIVWSRN